MFSSNDYLKLAERLASSPNDEAALRTAIGRAYYSAFHVANELYRELRIADQKPTVPERDSVHMRVTRALVEHTSARLRHAGVVLASLRRLRNDADYRFPFEGDIGAAARKAIRDAYRVIEDLKRYRAAC